MTVENRYVYGSNAKVELSRAEDGCLWVWFHWTDNGGEKHAEYVCVSSALGAARVEIEGKWIGENREVEVRYPGPRNCRLVRRALKRRAYKPDGQAYP